VKYNHKHICFEKKKLDTFNLNDWYDIFLMNIKIPKAEESSYFIYINFMLLLLSFCLSAVSDYRQSLQFQNLNAEKQNIQLEVCSIIILLKDNIMWKLN
jgi:hypothetical protein